MRLILDHHKIFAIAIAYPSRELALAATWKSPITLGTPISWRQQHRQNIHMAVNLSLELTPNLRLRHVPQTLFFLTLISSQELPASHCCGSDNHSDMSNPACCLYKLYKLGSSRKVFTGLEVISGHTTTCLVAERVSDRAISKVSYRRGWKLFPPGPDATTKEK